MTSQTLIPLFIEDWPPEANLSPEEETYQEHWGEYKAWWYGESDSASLWWFAQQRQIHPDYTGVELFEEFDAVFMTDATNATLFEDTMTFEEAMEHDGPIVTSQRGEHIEVCKSCRRCFDGHHYVGTWSNAIPSYQLSFKCKFCGPPLPAGKQCIDPVMFQRWKDYERIYIGEPGGSLTIVHATYGGPSCPDHDVTDKVRRIIQFQQINLGRQGYIDVSNGIHEWIGDPDIGVAKVLRIWFTIRTSEERLALEVLQRLSIRWREMYYAPGGAFEASAAKRFERLRK